jgi:LacI family transcriptional regulator
MVEDRNPRHRADRRWRRRVTLAQVAEEAGVSLTTASYIVNGRGRQMRIATSTEARVAEAMRLLDYRPNRAAQTLRTATTQSFGVITDFVAGGEFSAKLLVGAAAQAQRMDHVLIISETGGEQQVEAMALGELLGRGVDGILYATRADSVVTLPSELADERTVLLHCVDSMGSRSAVVPDEEGGGWLAADLLASVGLGARIHLVGEEPAPEVRAGRLRVAGIDRRLAEADCHLAGRVACDWDVAPAYAATAAWLAAGAHPEALICLNDRIAMGVSQALAEHGLSIPGDVSVVSFDGSDLAGWLRPSVTSIELPFEAMGELAVRRLVELGSDDETARAPRVDVLPMTVKAGDSVRSVG